MKQLNGAIIDKAGKPQLSVSVQLLESGTYWSGTIRPRAPVPPDGLPRQGALYCLLLKDGRQRSILIKSVSPGSTDGSALQFQAEFIGSGIIELP
jgi:hypothetical protein